MNKEKTISETIYQVHLKDGDVIHLGGIPYRLFGKAVLGGNTEPTEEMIGMKVEYEKIELSALNKDNA